MPVATVFRNLEQGTSSKEIIEPFDFYARTDSDGPFFCNATLRPICCFDAAAGEVEESGNLYARMVSAEWDRDVNGEIILGDDGCTGPQTHS